ncbi:MAG: sce7726 family protein [Methylococcales bacterium]|nr:sce7726 family protein [Methylococcales bacterium]
MDKIEIMENLNDAQIRPALIAYFESKGYEHFEIMQELHVHRSQAIADVVTLRKESHCYEIKGDGDKINRILEQGRFYEKSFRRITVVTTDKHLKKVVDIAPPFWGIMVARVKSQGEITINIIRRTRVNPNFDIDMALQTLWKSEIIELLPIKNKGLQRQPRATLIEMLAESKKKLEISQQIAVMLGDRHKRQIANNYEFLPCN